MQAVQALYLSTLPVGVSFVTGGQGFSLTNADVLAQTFNAAIASFGNSSSRGATLASAGGRRLMQVTAAAAAAPAPAALVSNLMFLSYQWLYKCCDACECPACLLAPFCMAFCLQAIYLHQA
jgi:hypothetical protein